MTNHTDHYSGLLSPYLLRQRLGAAKPFLQGRVLDYGCHVGALADLVPADRYVGLDIDADILAEARRNHPDHEFVEMGALAETEQFDTVAALAVLEHVSDPPGWAEFVKSRLRPGGRVVVTTPHKRWEWVHGALSKIKITSPEASDEHNIIFDQASLSELFEAAGFKVVFYRRFVFRMNQVIVAELP